MNAGGFFQFGTNTTARLLLAGFLAFIMLVPMMMVEKAIGERGTYYYTAEQSVREGWANAQALADPVLVVPYSYQQSQKRTGENNQTETVTVDVPGRYFVFAEDSKISGDFKSEARQRGLFSVPIYAGALTMAGSFAVPDIAARLPAGQRAGLRFHEPYMVLKIADPRGLHGDYAFTIGGESYKPEPGTRLHGMEGIHIPVRLDAAAADGRTLLYDFSFSLKGTNEFRYLPSARQATLEARSNWPHPSFGGQFLPAAHDVRADGFGADWSVGALATNGAEKFERCAAGDCSAMEQTSISIGFMQGTDLYSRLTRTAKYGILFISLTYGAFFMVEVLRRCRIHPVQYLMVGAGLTMFYLLLLALAEHIGFAAAYAAASAATALLLGYYISFVARSRAVGAVFGGSIGALYAALYAILGSEDYALLMGTGLLFAVLAAAMIVTRRIDWYAIGTEKARGA